MLNAAFAPELRRRASQPLVAGRAREPPPRRRRRAAAVRPRPAGRRAAGRAAGHRHRAAGTSTRRELGLAGARRAAVAARRGAAGRAPAARGGRRRPPARATSSCSCARPPRCGCSSRRSRSRACRPTSSAAAATGRRSRSATALAYLAALANPRDEEALLRRARLAVLRRGQPTRWSCSPQAGRDGGRGAVGRAARAAADGAPAWLGAAARPPSASGCSRFARASSPPSAPRAERLPAEVLLERAIAATGYDLAILARAGGERRLANLRKLMRLAREYERAEGRDLRGFLDFAATQDLARGARGRGGARVRGARRRAADDDPPRQGARVPGRLRRRPRARSAPAAAPRLLIGRDGDGRPAAARRSAAATPCPALA